MQGERGIAHRAGGGKHLRMIGDGGAVDLCHCLAQGLLRRGHVGACGGDRIAGMREFFGRDGAVGDQSAAPFEIIVRGALRLLTLRDLRAQLVALRKQTAHLAHGSRQVRFRVLFRDLGIGRVEMQQGLAGGHSLSVIDVE